MSLKCCATLFVAACGVLLLMHLRAFADDAPSPRLFAPGVISGPADDLSPAFTPDGNTVYFNRSNGTFSVIMVSTLSHGVWSTPAVAPFSGKWNDIEPAISPDGSFLVFASNRPKDGRGTAIDGTFNGRNFPGGGGNLWRVNRAGTGWTAPERLPDSINTDNATFSPGIVSDGSIYFMKPDSQTGYFRIYRSQYSAGAYLPAVVLSLGDQTMEDVDPAVAPDESFLIFSANHPGGKNPKRLHIAYRKGQEWTVPQDLGDSVNEHGGNIEARLGPDHRTLYFSTNTVPPADYPRSEEQIERDLLQIGTWANGRQNIWSVPLDRWLRQAAAQRLSRNLIPIVLKTAKYTESNLVESE